MTTFEEVSSSPESNFKFWTNQVKQHLMFYRISRNEFKKHGKPGDEIRMKSYKKQFKRDMQRRREQYWLNKE